MFGLAPSFGGRLPGRGVFGLAPSFGGRLPGRAWALSFWGGLKRGVYVAISMLMLAGLLFSERETGFEPATFSLEG